MSAPPLGNIHHPVPVQIQTDLGVECPTVSGRVVRGVVWSPQLALLNPFFKNYILED